MNQQHNDTHESSFMADYFHGVGAGFADTMKLLLLFLSGIWLLALMVLPFWILWSALNAVINAFRAHSVSHSK